MDDQVTGFDWRIVASAIKLYFLTVALNPNLMRIAVNAAIYPIGRDHSAFPGNVQDRWSGSSVSKRHNASGSPPLPTRPAAVSGQRVLFDQKRIRGFNPLETGARRPAGVLHTADINPTVLVLIRTEAAFVGKIVVDVSARLGFITSDNISKSPGRTRNHLIRCCAGHRTNNRFDYYGGSKCSASGHRRRRHRIHEASLAGEYFYRPRASFV